jgi:hypothetical protein
LQKYSNQYIEQPTEGWQQLISDLQYSFRTPHNMDALFETKMSLHKRANEVIKLILTALCADKAKGEKS